MATTVTEVPVGTITVPLEKIHVPANVRELDPEHVDALAGSIALQGQLVPVIVTIAEGDPAEQGFTHELVAGFHRHAAILKLGYAAIDAVVRERDAESQGAEVAAARATENIARKQLTPYEEALAVKAMLDRNLTEDGAAQALGWPKVRVTARVKLLELPETAQKLVGAGTIPLACVDTLRGIGEISEPILNALVDYVAEGGDYIVDELQSDTGRAIGRALNDSGSKTFAAYLTNVDAPEIEVLKLGKKATAQFKEIERLHKELTPYPYGPPPIRFSEQEVDQARAARVLIEGGSLPVIVDRPLYRELCKDALKRTADEFTERAAQLACQRAAQKTLDLTGKPVDPAAEPKREHRRQTRQFAAQAHGVNIDLGWSLRKGLGTVDPSDMTVARFFAYAALGSDYHSGYGKTGETVLQLAVTGIRLVVEEFRTDVTKLKKDGTRGVLRIDYGDPHKPQDALAWLWKYVDGARTAGDLYGRVLVVIAAEQYASRLVVPSSQQHRPLGWHSHNDQAAKALAKLAGPYLPVTFKQLQKAIAKAKAEHDKQLAEIDKAQHAAAAERPRGQRPDLKVIEGGADPEPDELGDADGDWDSEVYDDLAA